jgi:predicted CXXCH cytochrome family protein
MIHEMNLVRAGGELCFECHAALGEKIKKNQFQHEPVTKNCLKCHDPHVSAQSPRLLKSAEPKLCLGCHKTDKPSFSRAHRNYPVTKGRCSSCHDPHGSNTARILFDNVHEPVADGKCHECHEKATSSPPFALKDSGFELCEGCHYEEVADIFNKSRLHWPIADKSGCLNCHAPHASPEDALMAEPMLGVCGRCHADTVARQERSQTKHPPIAEGECSECHSPHSSDNLFLLNEASELDLCAACHEWQMHSTHPIGEKHVDPRNQNVSLKCSSCHRTHGTEYEHFIYFDTTNEMCIQCHAEYRK